MFFCRYFRLVGGEWQIPLAAPTESDLLSFDELSDIPE